MDLALGGQADKFAGTLCVKRLEFAHEKEVRVLIQDTGQSSDVLNIPFAYDRILDDAVLDPRLDVASFETMKSELLALGCSVPITQSDLYKMDEIIIRLD